MITKIVCFLFGLKKCSSLKELKAHIKAGKVGDLADWIEWRIPYVSDNPYYDEEYKDADRTIRDGKGDCEDKAIVAWEVIRSWPLWNAWLVRLERDDKTHPYGVAAHAACIYEAPDGTKGIIEGRAHNFSKDTDWCIIFRTFGWHRAWWTDEHGNKENRAGWSE